jgi:hypothetical protein
MTFENYCALIQDSVIKQGYDEFFPSLCVVKGDSLNLKVLEIDLTPDGEKEAAMKWLEQFIEEDATIYFAYRAGDRLVHICEVIGYDMTRMHRLQILPQGEEL